MSNNIIDEHTHPYTYACIYTHVYIYTYVHNSQRVCVSQMCTLVLKTHLCNVHTCPCTSAQNTCPKMHATLTANKCTYIYTYTHMHTHTYAHECTCACMTPSTRWSTETETHNLCRNMHTHKHTHVYKRIHIIYTYTHADMYIYTCPHTYTHTHIYTHTHKMYICTHTSTSWTTARQRPRKELMQTQEALHASCVWRNQSHLAPPMRTSLWRRENGGNVILFRSIDSGSRLGRAMNLVDWLRTSADERVLSGRCAVVICVMGCLRGLVVLYWPFVSREQSLCSFSGLDSCALAYCGSAAPLLSLQSF